MTRNETNMSVQPAWCRKLPLQQQSVLLLAARGPDGIPKTHPCKNIVRAYRATVLVAAARKRPLHYGERADSFMSLDRFANQEQWDSDVYMFFNTVDQLPHHFLMHLAHGAEIIGYEHPDFRFRERWLNFYWKFCEDAHLTPETREQMNERLNDVFGPERVWSGEKSIDLWRQRKVSEKNEHWKIRLLDLICVLIDHKPVRKRNGALYCKRCLTRLGGGWREERA